MTTFVIVFRQRSGSELLVSLLDSHPRIRCHRELFLPDSAQADSFAVYARKSPVHRIARRAARGFLMRRFIAKRRDGAGAVDAFGFKVAYSQWKVVPEIEGWILGIGPRVIHLVRTNLLRRLVSQSIARARGRYQGTATPPPLKVRLEAGKLAGALDRSAAQIDAYRRKLEPASPLEVSYEALDAERDATTARILDFIGVARATLGTDLARMNPQPLSELVENWDEVVAALRGTGHEAFLAG